MVTSRIDDAGDLMRLSLIEEVDMENLLFLGIRLPHMETLFVV
jgi:hypothetical protein